MEYKNQPKVTCQSDLLSGVEWIFVDLVMKAILNEIHKSAKPLVYQYGSNEFSLDPLPNNRSMPLNKFCRFSAIVTLCDGFLICGPSLFVILDFKLSQVR